MTTTKSSTILLTIVDNGFILVPARINNIAVYMILDTGANHSVIDKEFCNTLFTNPIEHNIKGIGATGVNENSHTIEIYTLELLNSYDSKTKILTEKNIHCFVLDLSYAMVQISDAYNIIGIIGNDVLIKHKVIIDLKQNLLMI